MSSLKSYIWRHRRWILWISLVIIIGGEAWFWWAGTEQGQFSLPLHSRYTALQDEPVTGFSRVLVNFRHFFLFWQKPPDTETYHSLYDLWLSDQSAPQRNLLHVLIFASAPVVLIRLFRIRAWETLLWLQALNILREYAGEGWRLEPSFSDLWVDTISMLVSTWIICRFFSHKKSQEHIEYELPPKEEVLV